MVCEEIRELLSEYLDDALPGETKAYVDEHLASCRACQQELASLTSLVRELRSLEPLEPPQDFLGRIHVRLAEPPWYLKMVRGLFLPMRIKIPLQIAGAVVTAFLVFSILSIQQMDFRYSKLPGGEREEKVEKERIADSAEMRRDAAKSPPSVSYDVATPREEAPLKRAKKGIVAKREEPAPSFPKMETRQPLRPETFQAPVVDEIPAPADRLMAERGPRAPQRMESRAPGSANGLAPITKAAESERTQDTLKARVPADAKLAGAAAARSGKSPMELVLRMRKGFLKRAAFGTAMEKAKAQTKGMQEKPLGAVALDEIAPKGKAPEASLERVKDLIEHVQGKVLSVEYEKETGEVDSVSAEIPATHYAVFYDELSALGDVQPSPRPLPEQGQQPVEIRIKIMEQKE